MAAGTARPKGRPRPRARARPAAARALEVAVWAAAAAALALMQLAATSTELTGVNALSHCPPGFLSCHDGECIRQKKFCDGEPDCKDGSDEHYCDMKCPPDYFQCHNLKCISNVYVCDGKFECDGGSDELDCPEGSQTPRSANCDDEEFRCADNFCIPKEWKCDNSSDCLDGSDETIGCTDQLECVEDGLFFCANHHCVPMVWRCDGTDDCLDNSDERGCPTPTTASLGTPCPIERGLYPCETGSACTELTELCNGKKECPDGSDEGPGCQTSKSSCVTKKCDHRCVPTPKGPLCVCFKGYRLSQEKCQDINECKEYGICSQKCQNQPGSYRCLCDPLYELQLDNKTCKASGPDPLLIFSLKTEIRIMQLNAMKLLPPVAKDQVHIAGVDYDGTHVYWTSLVHGEEAIIRSTKDGSNREIVVSSGLGLPEDLAIDWLTNNIYFTDSEVKHIGVCRTDGKVCASLVNEDIDSPRAISLYVAKGLMFWTDWGHNPMVARAGMDGSSPLPFVSNVQWPSGLALDIPNERVYWTDTKLAVIESIKLDGTDRRPVLSGVVRHPYSLAVFEENFYWSDRKTSEIEACNKFTGKNIKKIYHSGHDYFGLQIYHPSLHSKSIKNPCKDTACTDICLLAPNESFTCACAEHKLLNEDKHSCSEIVKQEELAIGGGNQLVFFTHQAFGKQDIVRSTLNSVSRIGALAYDNTKDILFISDTSKKRISMLDMKEKRLTPLVTNEIGTILGLDFDFLADNLYWCDSEKETVEVMSMATRHRKTLLRTYGKEIPLDIVVVPQNGIMFMAFKKSFGSNQYHIDKMHLDGIGGVTHLLEGILQGPDIALAFEPQLKELIIADSGRGTIEVCEMDGTKHIGLQSLSHSPISVTSLGSEIFWTSENSELHWSSKIEPFAKINHMPLETFNNDERIVLASLRGTITAPNHACRSLNGGCSDICLSSLNVSVCVCADNRVLQSDNKTCSMPIHCTKTQYKCETDNLCIPAILRCNSHIDCPSEEDEKDCPKQCLPEQFECANGQCINKALKCDDIEQCLDGSDEFNCHGFNCRDREFKCGSGECIPKERQCDYQEDCRDGSDEKNCDIETCSGGQFRCKTGNCIPVSFECDEEINCPDGSDEHENCPPPKCQENYFTCENMRCIEKSFICNGQDDCGDNSDEINCGDGGPKNCKDNEFKCFKTLNVCLPPEVRCNGSAECPKGEDELGCGCSIHEFECDINRCIDERWVCDGVFDCNDKSDEEPNLCKPTSHPEICLQYRCTSGECLDYTKVCDYIPHCKDHSDEGEKCGSACNEGNPCLDICNPTPSGPVCSCHPGFSMRAESTECIDDDECSENICSQNCHNLPGSFFCSCAPGYALRLDRVSCKAEGDPVQVLFVANGNEIRMAPYSLKIIRILIQYPGINIIDLAVSIPNKTIYWSTSKGEIFIRSLINKDKTSISNLGRPEKLAVDWITENIYFSGGDVNGSWIKVCNFIVKKCAKVVDAKSGSQIQNIVVDPIAGYIFWTERKFNVFDEPQEVIKGAELSGANPKILVGGLSEITGLTADLVHRWIFWIDSKESVIGTVGYHGEGRHVVFDKKVRYASGLDFFEDSVYWLSTNTGRLRKCKVFGQTKHCEWVQLNSHDVQSFVLMQDQMQRSEENHCNQKVCSHLCVSGGTKPQCLCPDGIILPDDSPCSAKDSPNWHTDSTKSEPQEIEEGSFPVIGICFIVMIIAAVLLTVYIFRKKLCFTPPDVSTGVHYITSTYSAFRRGPSVATTVPQRHRDEEMEVVSSRPAKIPPVPLRSADTSGTLQFNLSDVNSDGEETDFPVKDTARLIP